MDKIYKNLFEELKAEYIRVIGKFPSWIKEYDIDFIVKLSDGSFYYDTKPRIETDFPVGYSNIGQGLTYDEANRLIESIEKDEEYFISRNLERSFGAMDDRIISGNYYTEKLTWGNGKEYNITRLVGVSDWEWNRAKRLPTKDEELLVAEIGKARERFKKRLQTYLKRYGLSKLRVWRYWIDE